MRFWLERGVDGFRLDTVNFYTHDRDLRSNPAVTEGRANLPPVNPFDMQRAVYSRNRPENLPFVERMRALTDTYDARMMVGEVGERGDLGIGLMAEYTRGDHRLHMAYSFDLLGPVFTAAHFRHEIETFFRVAPDGWPCWSFSNHDVNRHVTRWSRTGEEEAVAKLSIAILASLPGSICLYQGEELGQTETELTYEELTDPPGLRFWPENKGRDGCRTPMVWEAGAPHAGFSVAKPWLPVKAPQAARVVDRQEGDAASVLAAYRRTIAFRQARAELRRGEARFLDLAEPVLGIVRSLEGAEVTGLFNLGREVVTVEVPGRLVPVGPGHGVAREGTRVTLAPFEFGWFEGA
jgi:alpha-glucosidase